MGENREMIDFGLKAAEAFLEKNGYEIVEREWRGEAGEVDLTAQSRDGIAFIDVRTRRGEFAQEPYKHVSQAKFEGLMTEYLGMGDAIPGSRIGYDIISINVVSDCRAIFRYHENVAA